MSRSTHLRTSKMQGNSNWYCPGAQNNSLPAIRLHQGLQAAIAAAYKKRGFPRRAKYLSQYCISIPSNSNTAHNEKQAPTNEVCDNPIFF